MSKICASCGATLEDNATFCVACGKPVSLFTPQPEQAQTTSGDMPAAEDFGAMQQQQYQQQPYGGQQYQQPYGQPQYQQQYQDPYQNMNAYAQSANVYNQSQYMGLNEQVFSPYSQGEQPVSVGQWMLTTIILCIPTVGFIYLILLAVGVNLPGSNKSMVNFARAGLIWLVIFFVIAFFLIFVVGISIKNSGFIHTFF